MANPAESEIATAIASFERATGLNVTIHDLDGRLSPYLSGEQVHHNQSLCQLVKGSTEGWRCFVLEIDRVRETWSRWPEGRVHRCHAGLIEWVVPLAWKGRLLGMVFAGQARAKGRGDERCCDYVQPASSAMKKWAKTPVAMQLKDDEAQYILEQVRQFASRLLVWMLRSPDRPKAARGVSRRVKVERFVADHHHQSSLCLADLAEAMGLSESRVAHLVREIFGQSFLQMVTAARINRACNLLDHSDQSILAIGHQAGFNDTSHFHRVFKKHVGLTPRRYRHRPGEGAPTTKMKLGKRS